MKKMEDVKVLFVEDEPLTRVYMAKTLVSKVKAVSLAQNGNEGLEKFENEEHDIIITDIKMPVMDGKEMISRIRQGDKKTPVIVLTAYDFTADELSATVVVRKPYVIKNILNQINKLVCAPS